MKNPLNLIIIFSFLLIFTFGCKQTETNTKTNSPTPIKTATPQPAQQDAVKKSAINIPDLVGKTEKEIIKILGEPKAKDKLNPTDKTGELSFDYALADGSSYFINFKKGKADYFHFNSKQTHSDIFTLGEMVGLSLKGVTPQDSNAAQITYSGNINGVDWHQIRVVASDSGYKIITLQKTL